MPSILTTNPSEVTTQNVSRAVDEVCEIVGVSVDPELRNKALRFLDRAATKLNLAGVHLNSIREYSIKATASQGHVSISGAPNWGWPYGDAYAISAGLATSAMKGVLRWEPWNRFRQLDFDLTTKTAAGQVPTTISIQSELFDKKAYLYPTPSAANCYIHIPYFSKVQRPSEESTLLVSDETYEALIQGAQAMMMQYRHASSPQVWTPFMQVFETTLARLRSATHRLHVEANNLTIQPDSNTGSPV